MTAGPCRFRGSPAGKCLPSPPHLPGGPAVEESTKERTIEKEKGTQRRAQAGAEGGGWAGGGKEREPRGARGDTPGKRRSGDQGSHPLHHTRARTHAQSHTSPPPPPPASSLSLPSMEKMKSLAVWISSAL